MTQTTKLLSQDTVSAKDVAQQLARELGGEVSSWTVWLANERKPGRVNRRLQPEPGTGRPRYDAKTVEAFVLAYKQANLHTNQRANRDRQLTPHISALKLVEGASEDGVLFVIQKPMAVFILSAEDARKIARRLISAADEVDASLNLSPPSSED